MPPQTRAANTVTGTPSASPPTSVRGRKNPVVQVLLSRETVLTAVIVVLAMSLCIALGLWQYGRHVGRVEIRDTVQANYSAAPVPIADILPATDSPLASEDQWSTVTLTGQYCTEPECILYVRNRPLQGDVGFWQLVPFTTADRTVLVVRGWVPIQQAASAPALTPSVPEGKQDLVVRLRSTETPVPGRSNPPGQLQTVTAADADAALPDTLPPLQQQAYGELADEPLAPPDMPRPLEEPDTSLGPHLSYAFQWWIFALFFLAGGILRTRTAIRDAQDSVELDDKAEADHIYTPSAAPRRRRRSTDEEEEDALLD